MTDITKPYFLWPLAVSIALCACEENPPDTVIPQFDRAQDVALVCYDPTVSEGDTSGLKSFLPLECCKNEGYGVDGYCDSPRPYAIVLAFVTQTTYGEVAVVDLSSLTIIDQDEQIPLNSFVPVGGQPNDIAASWDGTMVGPLVWVVVTEAVPVTAESSTSSDSSSPRMTVMV